MLASCLAAGTGHVGGCSGAVELLVGLYFGGVLRFDPASPASPSRDRVLVRGHLGPVRYAIFSLLGWVSDGELPTYAALGSRLQGHETPDLPGVDLGPSGSLGMLLSFGVGSAIVAASAPDPWRTFVFLGDGEEQEGNVAEAARHASYLAARGLVAVIDANGRQLSGPVSHADGADLAAMWRGYGWQVVDLAAGNDVTAVTDVLERGASLAASGPVMILARTVKGYGIPGAGAHFSGYHELAHCDQGVIAAAAESIPERQLPLAPRGPLLVSQDQPGRADTVLSSGELPVARSWPEHPDDFQLAYLAELARAWDSDRDGRLYFLFADTFPEPLLTRTGLASAAWCGNVGIREQHLIALAHGISRSDPHARVIAHTGDAFLLRALDQLMAAASVGSRFVVIGDDAGITNARNGASHQSSAQPLLLGALPGIGCFEPADGHDFAAVMNHVLTLDDGICYVRVHDGVLARAIEVPPAQRATDWYTVRPWSRRPDILLVASGFMVGQAADAAHRLEAAGVDASVVNVLRPSCAGHAARAAGARGTAILTVYDGDPDVLAGPVRADKAQFGWKAPLGCLGFRRGTSGRLEELLPWAGLDGHGIARSAAALLAGEPATPPDDRATAAHVR
jgi:transketolase